MPTTFHRPLNGVSTTVASPRAAGSPTLVVAAGAQFGSAFPLILTIARAGSVLCTLEATARSGNTLTVSGAIEGTTDGALVAGDLVEVRPTALAIAEIQDAVLSDEAAIALLQSHAATDEAAISALQTAVAGKQAHSATLDGLASATYAGGTLLGGQGTGVPAAVAVGSGLSLAGGTLTAAGGGGGMAIGGAIAGGTAGRVLIEGAGPVLADAANFTYIGGNVTLVSGDIQVDNGHTVYAKDNGGSYQRLFFLDAGNNYGCRNEAGSGSAFYGLASYLNTSGSIIFAMEGRNYYILTADEVTFQKKTSADGLFVSQRLGAIARNWADATTATRKGRVAIVASDWNGDREGIRVETDGAHPLLGFYGSSAVAKAAAPTTLADVIALLRALGLCS